VHAAAKEQVSEPPVRNLGEQAMLLAEVEVIREVTKSGIGLGSVIAVVCSWQRNRSIIFAIVSGIFGWLYVIYFALTRKADEEMK
jgi:hypothetical protein